MIVIPKLGVYTCIYINIHAVEYINIHIYIHVQYIFIEIDISTYMDIYTYLQTFIYIPLHTRALG